MITYTVIAQIPEPREGQKNHAIAQLDNIHNEMLDSVSMNTRTLKADIVITSRVDYSVANSLTKQFKGSNTGT